MSDPFLNGTEDLLLLESKNLFHMIPTGEPKGLLQKAFGCNPLCGDEVMFFLTQDDAYWFHSEGCLLTRVCASVLCREMKGMDLERQSTALSAFEDWIKGSEEVDDFPQKLTCFAPMRAFLTRHRCVTFVVDTFKDLIQNGER